MDRGVAWMGLFLYIWHFHNIKFLLSLQVGLAGYDRPLSADRIIQYLILWYLEDAAHKSRPIALLAAQAGYLQRVNVGDASLEEYGGGMHKDAAVVRHSAQTKVAQVREGEAGGSFAEEGAQAKDGDAFGGFVTSAGIIIRVGDRVGIGRRRHTGHYLAGVRRLRWLVPRSTCSRQIW